MKFFLLVCLVLLALTGLDLFYLGQIPVTPFLVLMPLLCLLYFFQELRRFPRTQCLITYLVVGYVLVVALFYWPTARWTSVFYMMAYFFVVGLYFSGGILFCGKDIELLAKFIILLYFSNVVIALLLCRFGFGCGGDFFRMYDDGRSIRPQGFSSEPSYAAFICGISLYSYLRVGSGCFFYKILWFALVSILMMLFSSLYGYLLLLLCLFYLVFEGRSLKVIYIVFFAGGVVFMTLLVSVYMLESLEGGRFLSIIKYMLSGEFDVEGFRGVDSSAYMRIGPFVKYLGSQEFWGVEGMFGHGPGSSRYYFGAIYQDAIAETHRGYAEGIMNLGFIPSFLFDYGVVGVALMVFLFFPKFVGSRNYVGWGMLALLVLNANFSTQLFCFSVIILGLAEMAKKFSFAEQTLISPNV